MRRCFTGVRSDQIDELDIAVGILRDEDGSGSGEGAVSWRRVLIERYVRRG